MRCISRLIQLFLDVMYDFISKTVPIYNKVHDNVQQHIKMFLRNLKIEISATFVIAEKD